MTFRLEFNGWNYEDLPDPVRLLAEVDQGVERAVRMIEPVAADAYRMAAPGGIGSAIVTRIKDQDGWRLVVTVADKGMAKPAAYWTNLGTGVHRPGGKPIRRRNGKPFVVRGRPIESFKGQKPQGWVPDARRQADAKARVIVEQHMPDEVTDQVRRLFG